MEGLSLAILYAVIIFIIGLGSSLAASYVGKYANSDYPTLSFVFSVLFVFSGGVLLAGGTVHLADDSYNNFIKFTECADNYTVSINEPNEDCDAGWVSVHVGSGDYSGWVCPGDCMALPYSGICIGLGVLIVAFVELLTGHDHDPYADEQREDESNATTGLLQMKQEPHHAHMKVSPPSLVLLLALSAHSVLAGFGLGVDTLSEEGSGLGTFIAIIAHKGFAAYALGSNFGKDYLNGLGFAWCVLLCVIFSITTPFGTVMGALVSNGLEGRGRDGLEAITLGIASGTFIYIAIIEMLMLDLFKQRKARRNGPLNRGKVAVHLIFTLVGFGAMSALAYWT